MVLQAAAAERLRASDPTSAGAQAVDRFIDGAKLAADHLTAANAETAEADTVVALLQRVLHPRLRAMLGESNLAVRQARFCSQAQATVVLF